MAIKLTLLICALPMILTGCACTPNTRTEYVSSPLISPPTITRPALDIDYIKSTDDPGTVIQAHRLTVKRLMQWGLELEAALDAYRTKKDVK